MAARSFAYHAHGTADSDKSPWFVYHDKTLNQQCMLAQARLPMINHLTSFTTNHYTVAMSDLIPKSSYKFYNGSLHCSDVGPYPRATGNYACPREHAFRKCAFRERRIKYNTRKIALSKVQALNSSEPSVLSDFHFFLRWSNFLKPKILCYAYFGLSNRGGTSTIRFYSLDWSENVLL